MSSSYAAALAAAAAAMTSSSAEGVTSPEGNEDDVVPSTSRDNETNDEEKKVDEQSQFELLHAIERFLEQGNFGRAAAALRRDINEKKLVPSRTDVKGTQHAQNYRQFLSALQHLPSSSLLTGETLPNMMCRLSTLADRVVAPPVRGLKLRLITNKRSAMTRTNDVLIPPRRATLMHGRPGYMAPTKAEYAPIQLMRARELGAAIPATLLPGEKSIDLIERHFRILGHLANVFCVAFDRTENYLITGADDNLVKVWHVDQAILKFTYRGHGSELADMSVSYCNQLVASGSTDKQVRVWRLQNGETLHVFSHHTAAVTVSRFLPFTGAGDMRYLVTAGNDCKVHFYTFNPEKLEDFPLIYQQCERDQPGARMVSMSHSPSGHIIAIGETHGIIRVYLIMEAGYIQKLRDITAHTDRVDSLSWSNTNALQFVSGAKDGLTKIWRYQYGVWEQTVFALSQAELVLICGANSMQNNPNSKNRYKILMVIWSLDDTRIITTGSDHSFRVWDAKMGTQLFKLSAHTDDAYHMIPHPVHGNIVMTTGHDGIIAVWDIMRGRLVRKWTNTVEGGEQASVYDILLTRDGCRFALVDNKGHVSMYGMGTNSKAKKMPKQQFYTTDYHPLATDAAGFAVDEQTGIVPHLMPPPRMINVDLDEYPPEIQQMVPGRENVTEDPQGDEESLICPWLTRDIVPRVDEYEMAVWNSKQTGLAELECRQFEEESVRERPSTPVVEVEVTTDRRGQARSSKPTTFRELQARSRENARYRNSYAAAMYQIRQDISLRYLVGADGAAAAGAAARGGAIDGIAAEVAEARAAAAARREANAARRAARVSMDENGEDEEEEEEEEIADDFETDTSDSDYETREEREERERRERQAESAYSSQGTASRPRRREPVVEEEEEEMDESSQHSRSERRRRRRGEEDDFGNDLSIDMYDVPTTSTGRRRRREEEDGGERPSQSNAGRRQRVRRSAERTEDEMEEERGEEGRTEEDTVVREERSTTRRQPSARDAWKFSFPSWMRETKRNRFPYVAQIGDHVVYFKQGHEGYLGAVEATGLYYIDGKMRPKPDIANEEFAIVEDVKYVLRPYRLTQLKLAKTDAEGRRTGHSWTVKHHDMDNVPDFIILRAFYEEGLAMALDMGDEIEAAIDDQWWQGTIEMTNRNDTYPNAHWQSMFVRWESGEDEALSPWDVRRKAGGRRAGPLSEEEIASLAAVPPLDGDWPEGDETGEAIRRRIRRALTVLGECDTVSVFMGAVPLDEYYDYATKVAYPMDLQTIIDRIDNQYYRRLRSLLQDIRHVALSAETYNLKDSPIVRNAKVMVEAVVRLTNDPSIEDVLSFYDSCHDIPDAELIEYKRRPRPEVNEDMLALLREREEAGGGGGGADGEGGEEGEGGAGGRVRLPGWISETVEILEEMMRMPCARHFLVQDLDHEELGPVWETCDDLSTLTTKVKACDMSAPKDIEEKMSELVHTVRAVVEDKRSEIYKDSQSLLSHFSNRFRGIKSKFESMQASITAALGISINRSMRRTRNREQQPHHAYNTRRADQSAALTAASLAAAAAAYDEQPSSSTAAAAGSSSSSRHAARHETGFYRQMANGGGGGGRNGRFASEETEISSSSSRLRRGGSRGRRGGGRMEEEEEETPPPRAARDTRGRRRIETDEEEEEENAVNGLADDENEEENGQEGEVEEDEEGEEEEEEEGDSESEEEDYSSSSRNAVRSNGRTPKNGSRKRKREEYEEEEEGDDDGEESMAASTSTSSSTRRSQRKKSRRRLSSVEEEEEEDDDDYESSKRKKKNGSRRPLTAAAAASSSSRPPRAAARQAKKAFIQTSDDEDEDDERVTTSVSSRGRQRKVRVYND